MPRRSWRIGATMQQRSGSPTLPRQVLFCIGQRRSLGPQLSDTLLKQEVSEIRWSIIERRMMNQWFPEILTETEAVHWMTSADRWSSGNHWLTTVHSNLLSLGLCLNVMTIIHSIRNPVGFSTFVKNWRSPVAAQLARQSTWHGFRKKETFWSWKAMQNAGGFHGLHHYFLPVHLSVKYSSTT